SKLSKRTNVMINYVILPRGKGKIHRITIQLLRIMRITSLLLVIGAMHVSATSLSQTVTLHVKDQSLRKIFNTIEKQTELLIFYINRLINPYRKASVQAADRPLDDVLQTLLNPMDLTFRIHESSIVITERRDQRNP